MKRVWGIFLVVVAIGVVCAICRVDQMITVAWIQFQGASVTTSSQRAAYIKSLLEHGEAGKRATRSYLTRRWRHTPPNAHDVSRLYRAKHAFVGLSASDLSKLIGNATRVEKREGASDLIYDGQLEQIHFGGQRSRLIFHLETGRVADVSRWIEFTPTGEYTNEFESGWMQWLPDGTLRKNESPNKSAEATP